MLFYLKQSSGLSEGVFRGHSSTVAAVSWNPGGGNIVSVDKSLHSTNYFLSRRTKAHSAPVTSYIKTFPTNSSNNTTSFPQIKNLKKKYYSQMRSVNITYILSSLEQTPE